MKSYSLTGKDIRRVKRILYRKRHGSNEELKKVQCQKYRIPKNALGRLKHVVDTGTITGWEMEPDVQKRLVWLADQYCSHQINYLGSGWVSMNYNAAVRGMEGHLYEALYKNPKEYFDDLYNHISREETERTKQIVSLLPDDYPFFQWNRDYKSGYTWRADYLDEVRDLEIPEGADIKTVWETCRLQFLVQMAVAALIIWKDEKKRDIYIQAFRDIVLDFTASNPMGVGCCWILAMEAGIRAVNLIIAYDIFRQIDENHILDEDFSFVMTESIYLHGRFIWDNLENSLFVRENANHYYSDIVGLLYISYALDEKIKNVKKWRRFSRKEFYTESIEQFYPEGSNIECSASYHRLAGEFLVFGCALLEGNGEAIPAEVKRRVAGAALFTMTLTKPDGMIFQVGDNDSGRLVAITETSLNHRSFIHYCSGLYIAGKTPELNHNIEPSGMETALISAISGKAPQYVNLDLNLQIQRKKGACRQYPVEKTTQFVFDGGRDKPQWGYYSDFGLYFYRQGDLTLFLYTGGEKGRRREGHSHNDILHCEITIAGKNVTTDPGTYVYILPEQRNRMRSRSVHFVPDYGVEPREFAGGWAYAGKETVSVTELGEGRITVHYVAANGQIGHERSLEINDNVITITDRGMREFEIHEDVCPWFSEGYGVIERERGL